MRTPPFASGTAAKTESADASCTVWIVVGVVVVVVVVVVVDDDFVLSLLPVYSFLFPSCFLLFRFFGIFPSSVDAWNRSIGLQAFSLFLSSSPRMMICFFCAGSDRRTSNGMLNP